MKQLQLSSSVRLPADIGTETIAVLGRRGSGKSNTGTAIMEELIDAGQQVVLIDPKGEGWGLKAQGGGGAGRDVIVFGEPEGDLPLREEHGETIADFVVQSGRSCVLSLAGLDADAAARRFVARFAERLFTLKKKPEHHTPLMVVLEEAHLFVPQRVEGQQADVVSRLQRLVRQGRSMGLGVMLIDQRPASVNKDVLTQIELMVCHQLTSPHDRKAVDAWIEANAEPEQAAEFRRTLPTLQPGEAWLWSPAKLKLFERAKIRRRHTFDSGSTPILGKHASARPKMRPVDLDTLRGQLDRVVEERRANDPATLKKTIADLQKQLAAKSDAASPPEPVRVEVPVLDDSAVEVLDDATDTARKLLAAVEAIKVKVFEQVRAATPVRLTPGRPIAPRPAAVVAPRRIAAVGTGTLAGPEQRIVDALAWWASIGVASPTMAQLGAASRYKHSGGSFSTYLSRLSSAGMVERGGGVVRLTAAGSFAANAPASPPTLADLHRRIGEIVDGPGGKLLGIVIGRGGAAISTDDLGAAAGYEPSGGSFSTYLSRLSSAGFIERSRGVVTPTAVLFPPGLE